MFSISADVQQLCTMQVAGCLLPLLRFSKTSLYDIRDITSKRETSGGAHLRGLGPGQHSSEYY